ncbi:histone-lysine N-methyltransferase SETMAR [Trichonephila clavipes]|nr:histone-lysine N-methyltransferase SETMAR [Trichonephila clavipes]
MEVSKEKIWFILQFFFDKGENANQMAKIANGVYGADTVTANHVQFWFHRFRSGIFDVKDAPRTDRPVVENVDKTTEIIEVGRHVSSSSIAQELKIDHKTVLNHLRKVGFKKKLRVWGTPINTKNMMDRISTCEALAKRNEIDPFLKRMVTGDEKGVTYYNIVRKRSWSKCGEADQTVAKPGLTDRKVLLSLLSTTGLFEASDSPELANRIDIVFHQDNARPYTSVVTRQKLSELSWEVLMHPPYSPDLAPSDYHLFPALQNFLRDKKLGSREDCENRYITRDFHQ